MANFTNPTKVITGPGTRWSYANVWQAKSINGGAPKFSVSLIIPKSDTATVNKIKAAIQAAYEEGQSKLKGSSKAVPALSILKTPLRDGDLERPDDTEEGAGAAGGIRGVTCLCDQGGQRMDVMEDMACTLRAEAHHPPCVLDAAGFCTEHSAQARGIGYEEETSPTLRAGTVPAAVMFENHSLCD